MNRDLVRQLLVALAYVGTVAMNVLANALPLAGRDTGEISDSFQVLFTPAGYVFSIWGLIYFGLGAYATFQLRPDQRENPRLRAIGWLFVGSCVLNGLWLVAWHNLAIGWSLVVMLGLLGSLIAIYEGYRRAPGTPGTLERWTVRVPFSIYLGWITVATVANVGIFLWNAGWRPGTAVSALWTVVCIAAAAAIGAVVLRRRRDAAYALVLVWAFIGIAVARWGLPLIVIAALAGAVLLAGLLLRGAASRASAART